MDLLAGRTDGRTRGARLLLCSLLVVDGGFYVLGRRENGRCNYRGDTTGTDAALRKSMRFRSRWLDARRVWTLRSFVTYGQPSANTHTHTDHILLLLVLSRSSRLLALRRPVRLSCCLPSLALTRSKHCCPLYSRFYTSSTLSLQIPLLQKIPLLARESTHCSRSIRSYITKNTCRNNFGS